MCFWESAARWLLCALAAARYLSFWDLPVRWSSTSRSDETVMFMIQCSWDVCPSSAETERYCRRILPNSRGTSGFRKGETIEIAPFGLFRVDYTCMFLRFATRWLKDVRPWNSWFFSGISIPKMAFAGWGGHQPRTVFARSRGCKIVNAQLQNGKQQEFSVAWAEWKLRSFGLTLGGVQSLYAHSSASAEVVMCHDDMRDLANVPAPSTGKKGKAGSERETFCFSSGSTGCSWDRLKRTRRRLALKPLYSTSVPWHSEFDDRALSLSFCFFPFSRMQSEPMQQTIILKRDIYIYKAAEPKALLDEGESFSMFWLSGWTCERWLMWRQPVCIWWTGHWTR